MKTNVCLMLLVMLAGCRTAEQPKQGAYAEPKVCGQCHASIAASYQKTGMGRSIEWAGGENVPATVTDAGRTYALSNRDGALLIRRDGWEQRADFAIGSGRHARAYVTRDAEGRYVEFPASWYAENGGVWDVSPLHARGHEEDARGAVSDRCLFCHSAYNTSERLQPIDCQRCHGPGSAHAYSRGREPIVNPKKLSRERQLDVCEQCHWQSTSGPLPAVLRRFGREVEAYRPGEALTEYQLSFDHAPGRGFDEKFELGHAAYRLRRSACFQKSDMTCSTCHDPHAAQQSAAVARCQQCHKTPHHPETTCIECHMPKRPTGDAPHMMVTDHFIRKQAATGAAPALKAYQGPVVPYAPAQVDEAYLAVAQVHDGVNLAQGIPQLEAALAKPGAQDAGFALELARAYARKGDHGAAVRWFDEALKRSGDLRPAVKGLAASLLALRQFDRVVTVLAAVKNPDAGLRASHARALAELGRLDEAGKLAQQAALANPALAEPHEVLSLVASRRGDAQKAGRR